jgi:phosphotransacetylase
VNLFLDKLKARARAARRRIVFAEADDARVIDAAHRLKAEGLADPVLISKSSFPGLETIDPATSPRLRDYAARYQ